MPAPTVTCSVCNQIASEKLKIKNIPMDFFNIPEQLAKEANLEKVLPLRRVNLPADPNTKKAIRCQVAKWNENGGFAVDLLGFVQVCPQCALRHKIEFAPQPSIKAIAEIEILQEEISADAENAKEEKSS